MHDYSEGVITVPLKLSGKRRGHVKTCEFRLVMSDNTQYDIWQNVFFNKQVGNFLYILVRKDAEIDFKQLSLTKRPSDVWPGIINLLETWPVSAIWSTAVRSVKKNRNEYQ